MTVPTEDIACFYIKYSTSIIVCFDKQEYALNYSLDRIQELLSGLQFYRVNRQFLINFMAVKEVEHYFLRKLYVKLVIETPDKLLINKEKSHNFLDWMENR